MEVSRKKQWKEPKSNRNINLAQSEAYRSYWSPITCPVEEEEPKLEEVQTELKQKVKCGSKKEEKLKMKEKKKKEISEAERKKLATRWRIR